MFHQSIRIIDKKFYFCISMKSTPKMNVLSRKRAEMCACIVPGCMVLSLK